MNTSKKVYLEFLDGIRGIAILGVFLYHCLGPTFGFDSLKWDGLFRDFDASPWFLMLYPLTYGHVGVAVFFVVSGFCIHLSYQRNHNEGWRSFFNRRLFRIYPPYLLAIALFFFVWPWGDFKIDRMSEAVQLVSHVMSLHNFDNRTYYGINPSFWSIAVEVQLYAIYPLLLLLTRRLGWRGSLVLIAAIEIGIRLMGSYLGAVMGIHLPHALRWSPLAFWLSWSLGAYICECFLKQKRSRLFRMHFGMMLAIAFAVPLFKPTVGLTFLAFSFVTAIAIDRLIHQSWKLPSIPLGNLLWKHLSLLGLVSYSFYLFHQPIIDMNRWILSEERLGYKAHDMSVFLACLAWYPVVLGLSYLLYRYVELPSIALGKVFRQRRQHRLADT